MTDRELLELAAKAAGVKAYWSDNLEDWQKDLTDPYVNKKKWNPLTDDGDAFRLAVALRLMDEVPVMNSQYASVNPLAATRRAIVRAAAEVGRNMT